MPIHAHLQRVHQTQTGLDWRANEGCWRLHCCALNVVLTAQSPPKIGVQRLSTFPAAAQASVRMLGSSAKATSAK